VKSERAKSEGGWCWETSVAALLGEDPEVEESQEGIGPQSV